MMPRRHIELPHMRTGEVDWNTLGNMLSAHLLGEVLCASYVDESFGRRASVTESFQADTDWEFFYKEHDVVCLRKQFSDSPFHAWMGRGVIDLPVQDVAAYLNDHSKRKQWDKYVVAIREERRLNDTDVILYLNLQATQCLVRQRRDFLYFERMDYIGDKYVRSAMSVDIPEYPPVRGITRAELHPGTGWVLEPYEGSDSRTLVSFCIHTDLKNLPPLIVNRATRRQPMSVYRIRELLTNPIKRSANLPERSTDTFTASDINYVNRQSMPTIDNDENKHGSRFYVEEQLSVRDFLINRPSLKRNQSMPSEFPETQQKPSEVAPEKATLPNVRPFSTGSLSDTEVEKESNLHLQSDISFRKLELHAFSRQAELTYPPSDDSNNSPTNQQTSNEQYESESAPKKMHSESTQSTDSGEMEYSYHSVLTESNNKDGVAVAQNVTSGTQRQDIPDKASAPYFTPESSTDEASLPPTQFYSPVSSTDNLSMFSDEELCISLPTLTLAQGKPIESTKASSSKNLGYVSVTDTYLKEKLDCTKKNTKFNNKSISSPQEPD